MRKVCDAVNAEDDSDHRGHTVLARKLREFLRWPNARRPVSWLLSAADGPSSAANASIAGAARPQAA